MSHTLSPKELPVLGSGPCSVLGPGGPACSGELFSAHLGLPGSCLPPPELPEPSKRTRPTFTAADKSEAREGQSLARGHLDVRAGLGLNGGFWKSDHG